MKIKKFIFLLLALFAKGIFAENRQFDPLEADFGVEASPSSNLSLFEDTIIQRLILLGTTYNKQATFLAVAFGVVVAIFFPQETRSFMRSFWGRINLCVEKIFQKFYFFKKRCHNGRC